MSDIHVRPATEDDVAAARERLPDLLLDRWRDGGNRRSLVAARGGEVVGPASGVRRRRRTRRLRRTQYRASPRGRIVAAAMVSAGDEPEVSLGVPAPISVSRDLVPREARWIAEELLS